VIYTKHKITIIRYCQTCFISISLQPNYYFTEMKHIVVLGGGFGGVEAVYRLRKSGHKVTLISNREFVFIYPISIWIPVSKLDFKDAQLSLSDLQKVHGFDLIIDEVSAINSAEDKVVLKNQTISYDYLIVAMGSSKVKHPGLEHTFSICGNPFQALKMKERFDELLEKGSGKITFGFGGNPRDKSSVRGGPAFELLFNFVHTLKKKKIYNNYEINFFAPMKEPGKKLGSEGFDLLKGHFKKLNVGTYVGTKIKEFQKDRVVFEDDTELKSDLTMFIPAGSGHPVMKNSDLQVSEAGFILIDGHCRVYGKKTNVYAVGDVARLEGPEWIAKQGHIAEVMAKYAVNNILNDINGNPRRYSYQNHLSIVCVMDTGNAAVFTNRTWSKEAFIPLPVVGHWMKRMWGWYWKKSKLRKFPRLAGM